MIETESDGIEYLRDAFKCLAPEKKDYILVTARSLLAIQEDGIHPPYMKNPAPDMNDREI